MRKLMAPLMLISFTTASFTSTSAAEDDGLTLQFLYSSYITAKACSDKGWFFTPDKIKQFEVDVKNATANVSLSKQQKEELWKSAQKDIKISDVNEKGCKYLYDLISDEDDTKSESPSTRNPFIK